MKKLNVVSCFDGISCGQESLKQLEIPVEKYYSSELDKYAIAVTQHNHPDTIQVGDITNWRDWDIDWASIDLIFGGSPCQGFSFAGKQLAFDDPRSKLFFVFVEIINHIKTVNPDVKFLLENVRMKQEYLDIISEHMGVQYVKINSALVSAQNRVRYYWTNIAELEQPENRGILLRDILETGPEGKAPTVTTCEGGHREPKVAIIPQQVKVRKYKVDIKGLQNILIRAKSFSKLTCSNIAETLGIKKTKVEHWFRSDSSFAIPDENIWLNLKDLLGIKLDTFDKSIMEWEIKDGTYEMSNRVYNPNYQAPTVVAGNVTKVAFPTGNSDNSRNDYKSWRKLTPLECERLQTLPDRYSLVPWQKRMMSNSQRYKMLGNGWTIEVIKHIFKNLHNT